MQLTGRIALVTGGTQGVGAAIAMGLAGAGARVVIHGLHDDAPAQATLDACRAAPGQAALVTADLSQDVPTAVEQLAAAADAQFGRVDLLVNNAGTYIDRPFLEMDHATYQHTMRLNVESGYFLTQRYARAWIAEGIHGRVLFTSSINALLSEPDHTAYDASKAAVGGLVRSLCVTLAPHRIRVNAVAPGLVRTPLTNRMLDADPASLRWMQWHTPNGQVPGAEVCAGAAVFLLSDAAEHIHGQTLLVDGGMSAWQQPDLPPTLRTALQGLGS